MEKTYIKEKKDLEERIIYKGPSEKATEIKSIVAEVMDKQNIILRKRGDIGPGIGDSKFENYQNRLNDKLKILAKYKSPINNSISIRISHGECHLSSIAFPEDANNFSINLERSIIQFSYKGYVISIEEDLFDEKVLRKLHKEFIKYKEAKNKKRNQ